MKSEQQNSAVSRRPKIRIQVFVCLLCFSAFVLILLWLFLTVFLKYIYRQVKISEINKIAVELSTVVASPDLSKQVEEYAAKNDLCIAIRDKNYNVLAYSCVSSDCIVHQHLRNMDSLYKYYNAAKTNHSKYVVLFERDQYGTSVNNVEVRPNFFFNTTIEEMLCTYIGTDAAGGDVIIMLDAIITPINATVTTLKTVCIYITILTLATAIIISIFMSKRIAKPLIKIDNTAKQLAEGNYNVHFDEGGYEEVSQLSKTLNHAAHELSTVENFRRELLANVSHDLRTPLTLISGYAEVMKDLPDEITPENLQTIVDEVNRMTLLVNDLLDVSKYDAGVQKLNLETFNLTTMIATVIERFAALTEKDQFQIHFDYAEEVFVNADELKLTQVVYNFLSNAIRHTGTDKSVYIKQEIISSDKKLYAQISITDTGDGICREKAECIWNRYFKIDKTYKRSHNGSGLGLYIVKSILELHRMKYGVIPVEDMPNHTGCTFWFCTQVTRNPAAALPAKK